MPRTDLETTQTYILPLGRVWCLAVASVNFRFFACFRSMFARYPVISATRLIVLEKDNRVRAAMVMMSMRLSPLYASWLLLYAIISVVVSVLMTLVALLEPLIFQSSDLSLIFVLNLLTVTSSYAFAFFLASFFKEAKMAALVSAVVYFVTYLPYVLVCLVWSPSVVLPNTTTTTTTTTLKAEIALCHWHWQVFPVF